MLDEPTSSLTDDEVASLFGRVRALRDDGVAIIQTLRFGRVYAALAVPSLVLVIATAAAGGILSLAGVATGLGGWLELIATTSALLWLTAVSLATQHRITTATVLHRSMADSQTPRAARPIGWTGGAPHLHLLG